MSKDERKRYLEKKCLARCVEERPHPNRPYGLDVSKTNSETNSGINQDPGSLYIVLFDLDAFAVAKELWQHTGLGVSSRFAERFLSIKIEVLDGRVVRVRCADIVRKGSCTYPQNSPKMGMPFLWKRTRLVG
jgi:hypothetical protein